MAAPVPLRWISDPWRRRSLGWDGSSPGIQEFASKSGANWAIEITPELAGQGLPHFKCEARNFVHDQLFALKSSPEFNVAGAGRRVRMVDETFESGMTVSFVARRHGVAPHQLFTWRRLVAQGSLMAAGSGGCSSVGIPNPAKTRSASCIVCSARRRWKLRSSRRRWNTPPGHVRLARSRPRTQVRI